MRYVFLCLLVLLFASEHAGAQPDSLMHTTYAKRLDYVTGLRWAVSREFNSEQERIATADSLQNIIDKVKKAGDPAFAYQLYFIRISDGRYMGKKGNLKGIREQIAKAAKEGYVYEATDARGKLADYYWRIEDRVKAMEQGLMAYEVYKKFTLAEYPERARAQDRLAMWYRYFTNYEKSKQLLLEILSLTNGEVNDMTLAPAMTLALSYRELKLYDSARLYFTKVYNYSTGAGIKTKQALAAGNIGSLYYLTEDYDNAILWSERELAIWKQRNNNRNLSSVTSYTYIADAYYKKGALQPAMAYIDSAGKLIRTVRKSFPVFRKFYNVKATLSAANGNYASAMLYKDSVMMMMDSIFTYRDKEQLLVAEKRVEAARHEKEIEYLDTLRKNSIWLRNFAIVMILMLAIITSLLINRSRLKHKQKEISAKNEQNKAEKQLLAFTKKFHDQNRKIDDLQEELHHMTDEQDVAAKHETIARLQQSTILTEEEWEEFRRLFEEVHTGFISKLKERFDGLTPAELRYLTLLKLNLSNREMANILGVGDGTIRNYKSRLRRKYGLADEDHLEEILKDI